MNEEKEKWNSSANDYQHTFRLGINDYNRSLLSFLDESRMIFPGCKVIDIGCGVGKYGTYFAELGFSVTLLDISDKMISLAKQNMSSYSTPWHAICCDFDALDIGELDVPFDLALSTMSPAIHNADTIAKMSSLSSWCFVARFSSWGQPLRDRILSSLGKEVSSPFGMNMESDCINLIQQIRDIGYAPFLKLVDYNWSDKRTSEEMCDYMLRRYLDNTDDKIIYSALKDIIDQEKDDNGIINDEIFTKVAWIYWKGVKQL